MSEPVSISLKDAELESDYSLLKPMDPMILTRPDLIIGDIQRGENELDYKNEHYHRKVMELRLVDSSNLENYVVTLLILDDTFFYFVSNIRIIHKLLKEDGDGLLKHPEYIDCVLSPENPMRIFDDDEYQHAQKPLGLLYILSGLTNEEYSQYQKELIGRPIWDYKFEIQEVDVEEDE